MKLAEEIGKPEAFRQELRRPDTSGREPVRQGSIKPEPFGQDQIKQESHRLKILVAGTPLMLTSLNEGVLEKLEKEGIHILRTPLLEYLWMLWEDQKENDHEQLSRIAEHMRRISRKLGERSAYAAEPQQLLQCADLALPAFAGANGRYRYAKLMSPPEGCAAVLHVTPRYENTAMVLDMCGVTELCPLPYYHLAMDGDWDVAAESRLRSFLYYI